MKAVIMVLCLLLSGNVYCWDKPVTEMSDSELEYEVEWFSSNVQTLNRHEIDRYELVLQERIRRLKFLETLPKREECRKLKTKYINKRTQLRVKIEQLYVKNDQQKNSKVSKIEKQIEDLNKKHEKELEEHGCLNLNTNN